MMYTLRPAGGALVAGYVLVAMAWPAGCASSTQGTGQPGAGGSSSGGSTVSGGRTGSGGSSGSGGTTIVADTGGNGSGGVSVGGNSSGGTPSRGGNVGAGGSGSGGSASGGSAGTGFGGNVGAGGSTRSSGATPHPIFPFGCKFAWGVADPGGSLASFSYVQFVSYWIESNISANGTISNCNGCNWLKSNVASTNLIPAYYAYIIGFLAHANGIVDGNQAGTKKLTTDGAALVKANYDAIVNAYAWYAQKTAAAWPTKPLVWLLEGDFVQLTDSAQSSPMTYADIGKLAADITHAIKSNMPNAVVAIDHSAWNSDDVTNSYWGAMASADYDMVWTTGVGNNKGFINGDATSSAYNAKTATYAYLNTLTGRTVLVDTSAGASAAGDSWSTASAADLNARIAEGVIAANITGTTPNGLQSNINNLSGLDALPSCK
jgi:hypothetical protein